MHRVAEFYRSTPGKKFVTTVTGAVLFAYVVLHTLGNLQIYFGTRMLNAYAGLLHSVPGLVWAVRFVIALSGTLHVVAAVQLTIRNWGSRPIRYMVQRYREADWAGRTMIWSGTGVAAFAVYHVLHLALGSVHPDFVPGDVYHNVMAGLLVLPVSIIYIAAVVLLGLHLYHGLWSFFQTLGWSHPLYDSWRRAFATAFAVGVVAGNVSIPVTVLLRLIS